MKFRNKYIPENNQVFIYLFFLSFFLIGILISDDYGISIDEPFHRSLGYFWYLQIFENFSNNSSEINLLRDKFNSMYWSENIKQGQYREYGVIFDLVCVFFEEIFKVDSDQQAFKLKHKFNFLIFFISSIFLFKLINLRFKKKLFALLVTFFYISSPRIFAESFYNPKDVIFMSFCLYSFYFCSKTLNNPTTVNIIFFSLFSALATSVRILGILFIFLFITFIIFSILEKKGSLKRNLKLILLHIFSYSIFLYALWPFLWDAPLQNIVIAFKSFSNYEWGGSVLYFGKFIQAISLPWHYVPVWIYITLPIIVFLFFLIGFLYILRKFIKGFLNLSDRNSLWRENLELIDFFLLSFFLVTIFAINIFNSTLYGGWRHLYFLYPLIIYFLAHGISLFLNFKIYKIIRYLISIILIFAVINNVYILIKFHPYQNVFFNITLEKKANLLFPIDYWGLSNADALKYIDNIEKKDFSISVASFTPLNYSKLIFLSKNKINTLGTDKNGANYILTNFYFENDPKIFSKYNIPEDYEKVYTIKRGNILINEIYKKRIR